VKEVPKRDLDPFMYKMLQAHQAISNVSQYGDVIERMVKTFFVREEEASVVLLVDRETDINAQDLFSLGHYLLRSVDEIIKLHNLPLSVHDIDVKLNLNSRGRIQLTSKDMRIIWMVAMLGVLTVGGGLKFKWGEVDFDLSTNGAIQKIIDYQNNAQDREIKEELIKSVDSLKVLPPEDALKVLKQFSTNKDNPK
jgi:hypothetical protein